jgi:zinc transporter, ZIP family
MTRGSLIVVVSPAQVAVLAATAGSTIFGGLPIGRLRAPLPRLKTELNAVATSILVFVLWDVLTHAWQPIDEALGHHEIGDAVATPPRTRL